jgi:hypothetical protein
MAMLRQMQRLQDSQDKRQLQQRKQSLQRRSSANKLTNTACSASLLQRCVDLCVFATAGAPPGGGGRSVGASIVDAAAPPLPVQYEALHSLAIDLLACTSSSLDTGRNTSSYGECVCDWELAIVGIILHRQLAMPLLLQAVQGTNTPVSVHISKAVPLHEHVPCSRSDFVALFAPLVALLGHQEVRVQSEAASGACMHSLYICARARVCVCAYVCVCVYMCICVCVYVCMYRYIHGCAMWCVCRVNSCNPP